MIQMIPTGGFTGGFTAYQFYNQGIVG